MKMVISEYKLVAGLIDSSYRSRINKEIKEKGSAKILICLLYTSDAADE